MLDIRGFFYCLTVLVAHNSGLQVNSNSNYGAFPASENGTCYKRLLYDDATAANITAGVFQTIPGTQLDGLRLGQDRITIIDCCDGFKRDEDTGKCETFCEEGCFGGTCTGPNECTCEDGWRAESGVCKPICTRRCPRNSYCFAPNVCSCKFGYEEIEGVCIPVCLNDCVNGDCVAHQDCRCHTGYFLNETKHCEPICEGGCAHGTCISPQVCQCDEKYHNPRNSQETCVPDCPNSCIEGTGTCLSPNVCTCNPGYDSGADGSCIPQCEDECAHGFCVRPGVCECNVGYILSSSSKQCVEKPKDYRKPEKYPQNSFSTTHGPYGNNYQTTVSTVSTYNDRTTFRPQIIGQRFNEENFNVQPITTEVNRYRGSGDQQSISYGPGRQNAYEPGRTHDVSRGVTQTPSTYSPNKYGNRPDDRTPNSHGNRPYDRPPNPYGNRPDDRTPNPYGNRPDDRTPNTYGNRPDDQTPRPQGYRPPQGQPREQDSQLGRYPYEVQDNRDSPKLFHPENPHSQTQSPIHRPQGTYSTEDPRKVGDSRNYNQNRPQQGPFPSQGSYPRPDSNTRVPYEDTQTKRPQGGPFAPQNSPQDNRNNYDRRPYISNQQPGQTQSPQYNTQAHHQQGVKTPYQRPNTDQYHRPGILQPPKDSGLELVYGINIVHDPPESRGSVLTLGPSQTLDHRRPQLQQEIFEPWNVGGSDGSARTYLLENGQVTIIDPFGPPICPFPCLNGQCVGGNQCVCNPGYGPDPTNPYSNMCLPICRQGCFQGVCTAPDLCICKPGHVKEYGDKNSNRCVLAK